MRNQYQRTMLGIAVLLFMLFSATVQAHTGDSGAGVIGAFMHLFTGEHVVSLILIVAVGVTMWRIARRSSNEA